MSPYTIGFIIEGVLAAVPIIAIICVTASGNGSAEKRSSRSAAKEAAAKPRCKAGGETHPSVKMEYGTIVTARGAVYRPAVRAGGKQVTKKRGK